MLRHEKKNSTLGVLLKFQTRKFTTYSEDEGRATGLHQYSHIKYRVSLVFLEIL